MSTIVVVEDEPDIARLSRLVLEEAGHTVIECSNVSELLLDDRWWEHRDAAIVDLMLPNIPGVDLLAWLVTHAPHVRRIAYSASEHRLADARNLHLAHCYLSKPFLISTLLAAVGD